MDLLAIDRRDEGLVQQAVNFGRDPVCQLLSRVDLGRIFLAQGLVAVVLHHRHECASAGDDMPAVVVEEFKEIALAGQQLAEKHGEVSEG